MIGLFVLLVERKMDHHSLEEFSWFYTLKSSKGDLGFYYFAKQATKDVQVITECLDNLKDAYFFMPEASVRGHFSEPSKLLIVFFLKNLYATCRLFFSDT